MGVRNCPPKHDRSMSASSARLDLNSNAIWMKQRSRFIIREIGPGEVRRSICGAAILSLEVSKGVYGERLTAYLRQIAQAVENYQSIDIYTLRVEGRSVRVAVLNADLWRHPITTTRR